MKAPEKIYVYIPDDDIVGTASIQKGVPHQFVTEEYIRTDVFIEKAWEWVEDNMLSSNQQDKSRLYFEQFKNYMQGE